MDCFHFRRCSQALQCSTSKCFSDSRAPVAAAQRRPCIRVSRWGCRGPPPLAAAAAASSSPSTSRPKADGPARGGGRRPARSGGRSRGGRGARWKKGAGSHFFSTKSWKQVGASEEMVEAVELLNITRPSHIQAAAYEAYENATQHLVVGDHAGSGKTLAYLMPVLQQLRREEAESSGPPAAGGGPRALVICPTEELAVQTYSVVRALSKAAPLRSACLTGGHKWRSQKQMLEAGVDVVVATPGRLQDHLSAGTMDLAQCRAVVLDEVDVLLGQNADFGEQMDLLQSHVPASSRFLFVTATLPEDIYAQMEMQFPANLRLVIGPGFHRTAPGVVERILDCSGGEEISEESGFERKAMALGAVLDETPAARSIIFCNKIATCRKVENFLKRRDRSGSAYRVLPYHSAIEDGTRKGNLQAFMRPPDADARSQDLILVCTDRASRGLDSSFTQHVVLFDFPRDPSEYVRRVGRTARGASGSGNVTVLVLGRQVKLAQELSNRNNKGLPVHRVPAAPGA